MGICNVDMEIYMQNMVMFAKWGVLGCKICWLNWKLKKVSIRKKHEHNLESYALYYGCKQIVLLILYKNKHIIVPLTEILVSYIPKFNALHTDLWLTAGIVAETLFNVRFLRRSLRKATLTCFYIWRQHMQASDWLFERWIDQLNESYMAFREWGRPRETTHLP